MNDGRAARCFLRASRHGVLATISQKLNGYPFGSVVPFVLDHGARPVILISRLAEHTRNVDADPRASLIVHGSAVDIQAAARLTLVGDARRVTADLDAVRMRYLNFFPAAEHLLALGDFAFYRIEPLKLRFVGGFGTMRWISAAHYAPPANELGAHESAIIAQMNADHSHSLRDCCRHFKQRAVSTAVMIGIDGDGFDVRAAGDLLRFDFARPVIHVAAARQELVELARAARTG